MESKKSTVEDLIAAARTLRMTDRDWAAQRHSFVYGNLKIENARITHEIVNRAARDLDSVTPNDARRDESE